MRMKCLAKLTVTLLLTAIAYGQTTSSSTQQLTQMSREEKIVRTAYAKFAYAVQVREIENMLGEYSEPEKIDRAEFHQRLRDVEITFQITNMKVGDIAEINNTKYSDLATKPSGDVIQSTPGYVNYTNNGDREVRSGVATIQWAKGQESFIEDWDTPYSEVMRLSREAKTNLSTYTRYAAYTSTVTFKGKSRTYRAMFEFGTTTDGKEEILPLDLIIEVNGGSLSFFMKNSVYPGTLLHENRNRGIIAEWLQSNQIASPGGNHEVECDLAKLKCGVPSEDMHRLHNRKPTSALRKPGKPGGQNRGSASKAPELVYAAYKPAPPSVMQSGDACSAFNTSSGPTAYQTVFDQTSHISGVHFLSGNATHSCTYTGSAGQCSSNCKVTVGGIWNETGIPSGFCHVGKPATTDGIFNGNGDAISCLGAAGGAVASCFFCNCTADISLTVLGTGVKVSSNNGIYTVEHHEGQSCGARQVADSGGGGSGGGGSDPGEPPCVLGSTFNPPDGSPCSPIIIDTEGEGFQLTSAANGVTFDIRGDGHPVHIAWTAPGSHNAFLALDRNGDGKVSSGKELFGNFTEQPVSNSPNGFLALAEFDKPGNGGNGDDIIDEHDAVYSKLRLWIDENHDGIAQPNELHTLPELGVFALSLDYKQSRNRDPFGNQFRFKARVNPGVRRDPRDEASEVGRWTYDVFLAGK